MTTGTNSLSSVILIIVAMLVQIIVTARRLDYTSRTFITSFDLHSEKMIAYRQLVLSFI